MEMNANHVWGEPITPSQSWPLIPEGTLSPVVSSGWDLDFETPPAATPDSEATALLEHEPSEPIVEQPFSYSLSQPVIADMPDISLVYVPAEEAGEITPEQPVDVDMTEVSHVKVGEGAGMRPQPEEVVEQAPQVTVETDSSETESEKKALRLLLAQLFVAVIYEHPDQVKDDLVNTSSNPTETRTHLEALSKAYRSESRTDAKRLGELATLLKPELKQLYAESGFLPRAIQPSNSEADHTDPAFTATTQLEAIQVPEEHVPEKPSKKYVLDLKLPDIVDAENISDVAQKIIVKALPVEEKPIIQEFEETEDTDNEVDLDAIGEADTFEGEMTETEARHMNTIYLLAFSTLFRNFHAENYRQGELPTDDAGNPIPDRDNPIANLEIAASISVRERKKLANAITQRFSHMYHNPDDPRNGFEADHAGNYRLFKKLLADYCKNPVGKVNALEEQFNKIGLKLRQDKYYWLYEETLSRFEGIKV